MNVLVVDDNRSSADALARLLTRTGHEAAAFYDGAAAIAQLRTQRPDLVLTDLKMEPVDGMEVLKAARALPEPVDVIVFTAFGDVDTAVRAVRLGASDFLMKPVTIEQITRRLDKLAGGDPDALAELDDGGRGFTAESEAGRSLLGMLELAADVPSPVWLVGEVGSGRAYAARTLHRLAHRDGPFLTYDPLKPLSSWPHGGTLLIERVDELPPAQQAALQRLLTTKPDDVRLVTTASPAAKERLAEGTLRSDLYYDLAVLELTVPPLRARSEDVLPLFRRALTDFAERYHRSPPELTPEAQARLLAHPWPGNLRELLNLAERAVVLGHLDRATEALASAPTTPAAEHVAPAPAAHHPTLGEGFSLSAYLEEVEKGLLVEALTQSEGDRTAAGKLLGVERNTLRYKLNKYKLLKS